MELSLLCIPVLSAYAKSNEKDAPFVVEALLREMQEKYESTGKRSIKPNSRSFNTCVSNLGFFCCFWRQNTDRFSSFSQVDAWAKSSQPNASERIMDWILLMEDNAHNGISGIRPNKWTYNAYLQALSKSSRPSIGDEAEKVLDQMDDLYRKGRIGLKPDVLTFTNVIHCLALSGAEDALERAMAILTRMEDLHAAGHGDVRPNAYTYNW